MTDRSAEFATVGRATMHRMLDRQRSDPIVGLTANDAEVSFDEAALVTREAMPHGIPGRTSWEIVVRNGTVPLAGELRVTIDLGTRRLRGVATVTSDQRQEAGEFVLRTTVLAGSGPLVDEATT